MFFIVVVSVALTVVLKAFEVSNQGSADPVLRRQSLAIAQSLLDEIGYKAFPSAGYVSNCSTHVASTCSTVTRNQFDDVMDYNGFSMTGIHDIAGDAIPGLSGYSASVAVAAAAFGSVPSSAGYRITVTVTDASGHSLALDGYRANY